MTPSDDPNAASTWADRDDGYQTNEATMSTNQNTTDTDAKAEKLAAGMDMSLEEFEAMLYRTLAEHYADDVAEQDGEQAVEENREQTIESMFDDAAEEVVASASAGQSGDALLPHEQPASEHDNGVEGDVGGTGESHVQTDHAEATADDVDTEGYSSGVSN